MHHSPLPSSAVLLYDTNYILPTSINSSVLSFLRSSSLCSSVPDYTSDTRPFGLLNTEQQQEPSQIRKYPFSGSNFLFPSPRPRAMRASTALKLLPACFGLMLSGLPASVDAVTATKAIFDYRTGEDFGTEANCGERQLFYCCFQALVDPSCCTSTMYSTIF